MNNEASKNEKMSYRLGDILTRLNSGEKLTIHSLAQESPAHDYKRL